MKWRLAMQPGWPDWANFVNFGQTFENYRSSPHVYVTFSYVLMGDGLVLTNWLGNFFQKLIWSPWLYSPFWPFSPRIGLKGQNVNALTH
jgi:hypothetical protein